MDVRTESKRESGPSSVVAAAHRWPSAVAVVVTVLVWPSGAEQTVRVLAEMLVLLPMIYLLTAAVGRPRVVWLVLAALGASFALVGTQDRVPFSFVLAAVAAGAVGWAWAFDRLDRVFWTQIAGTLVFVAIALAAQHTDPTAARYLVAAGWIGHGLWDFAHHRANRAVARSFAEFCAVVDVLIGAAVLLVP
ncbi:hypothetical protein [Nocardia bhagyanarayanae]|uniref:Uncharacterized protein n=1 Tax=Nocardia bhagyanarayanae TaxID=1215925 RepID=A0A543FG81_9NOCA|nr:hypothetical protein [Nocardia bhagyanarayanae]TQM32859.1 hypothetical protein FB390_4559 [Nocardia bhagyanarayanae]